MSMKSERTILGVSVPTRSLWPVFMGLKEAGRGARVLLETFLCLCWKDDIASPTNAHLLFSLARGEKRRKTWRLESEKRETEEEGELGGTVKGIEQKG